MIWSETILRDAYPQKGTRIGPEDYECIRFVEWLKAEIKSGRMKAAFMHIPNEGWRSYRMGSLQRAKGLISGAPDYVILYEDGAICLEFKSKTGSQSKNQRDFEAWVEDAGVPYILVRSADEAVEVLLNEPKLWTK